MLSPKSASQSGQTAETTISYLIKMKNKTFNIEVDIEELPEDTQNANRRKSILGDVNKMLSQPRADAKPQNADDALKKLSEMRLTPTRRPVTANLD